MKFLSPIQKKNLFDLQYEVSFKELYNNFEFEHNLYFKVAENLKQKKELLYNNKYIEKWELKDEDRNIDFNNKELVMKKMLPNDTKIVNEIKKYLIYYATQLDSENKRVKEIIEKHNNDLLCEIKDNNVQMLYDLNKFWELMSSKN